jgi:predicted Rossmann-fold nucleotide-binding protein
VAENLLALEFGQVSRRVVDFLMDTKLMDNHDTRSGVLKQSHQERMRPGINAVVNPGGSLEVLSQREVEELCNARQGSLYETFRRCCLAVLNCGTAVDDTRTVLETHSAFDVRLVQKERGVAIEIVNAPPEAFVDGKMIRGIREHLFAVLRDVLYVHNEIERSARFNLADSAGLTDAVFNILRNAGVLRSGAGSPLVVCWGGHSISRDEYNYTKKVGYELGLRGLNVCTGCGPGAMKGPMKGAAIGQAKQRIREGRFIGVTEPGIIAAESPNPIVNELVIMPDIEKRLEAFVRIGHGFIVFPGGVGTAEEILYLLGVLLHPENCDMPFPLLLTGPPESESYFSEFVAFIDATLGSEASRRLHVITADPLAAAHAIDTQIGQVLSQRKHNEESYSFNWSLHLDLDFQKPFRATHENMAQLTLDRNQPQHQLACNLRRVFSGIVAGNVKEEGMRMVEDKGPFEIHGYRTVMEAMDRLLRAFVSKERMRLRGRDYTPCYRLVS